MGSKIKLGIFDKIRVFLFGGGKMQFLVYTNKDTYKATCYYAGLPTLEDVEELKLQAMQEIAAITGERVHYAEEYIPT